MSEGKESDMWCLMRDYLAVNGVVRGEEVNESNEGVVGDDK